MGIATARGGGLELCPSRSAGHPEIVEGRDRSKGACFQLTLPAHAVVTPSGQAATAASEPRALSGGKRRALLVRLLARRDYEVSEAGSCAEAKVVSDGQSFDLVLCDIRLGDGNGGEILRHLRQTQPDLGRRFVFITGDITALADTANEFGDVPVLTKPFTATDLDRVLGDVEVGV